VLNASRHHSNEHLLAFARTALAEGRCSTPHGITATSTSFSCVRVRSGAAVCSTPHGITATSTKRRAAPPRGRTRAQRLTASQQRAPSGCRPPRCGGCGAQRLTASQQRAPAASGGRSSAGRGAQRLTASQQRAPITAEDEGFLGFRCSTPHGITATSTGAGRPAGCWENLCSTPHGITATSTPHPHRGPCDAPGAQRLTASQQRAPPSRAGPARRPAVLNASRHHSNEHDCNEARRPALAGVCSTPHGITATSTTRGVEKIDRAVCAQRLTASQQRAPNRGLVRAQESAVLNASRHHSNEHARGTTPHSRRHTVLNASRHHSNEHASAESASPASRSGAQRLTASQQRARARPRGGREGAPVLNASRHHSNEHLRCARC